MESYLPSWIDLVGVVNMRDVGGMPTLDGAAVRSGRLIRADNLQDLTHDDVEQLIALGLRDVVDLRSRAEVSSTGRAPLHLRDEVAHHYHSLLVDWDHEPSAAEALATEDDTTTSAAPSEPEPAQEPEHEPDDEQLRRRAEHYLDYLRLRPDSLSAALAVLAAGAGATIVHCAAGKDRTGTIVAMALDVAGVGHDHIVADYARSAERIEAILGRLQAEEFYAADPHTYRVADQTPRAETMRHFLTALQVDHGGSGEWLRAQGWSARDVGSLRSALREE